MKLLLIRHGFPNYELDCLTQTGHVQAELLSERFVGNEPDEIYSSTMGRAVETMEHTLKKINRTCDGSYDWARELPWCAGEYMKTDRWYCPWDIPRELLLSGEKKWYENPLFDGKKCADSYELVTSELDTFLEKQGFKRDGERYICTKDNNKTVAIFCHAAFTCAMTAYLTGLDPTFVMGRFGIHHTAVTSIVFEKQLSEQVYPLVEYMGDISHLFGRPELHT